MPVAVAERKKLYTLIDRLPDDKLPTVIEYVTDSLDEAEPNEETIKAFEDIEAGRNLIGPFDDVDSLFDALLQDGDEQV